MQRRILFSGASVLALAACATGTGTGTTTTMQSVMYQIQYILPLLKALVIGMSIAVPGSAALLNAALPYLDEAAAAFQLLDANAPVASSLPTVQKIEVYLKQAVDTVANVVNGAGSGSKLAQYTMEVQEAQAVLALITAFANGVQSMPTMAKVRSVSLPLLHH